MQVKYVGPSGSGVDVIHPDPDAPDTNTKTHFPPGEAVTVPEPLGRELVAQTTFTKATSEKKG